MFKTYLKTDSFSETQRAYRIKFSSRTAPDHKVIKNIISTFEKSGSVVCKTKNRGPPSQKREDAKNQLEVMITENPTLSTRVAASAIGVSQTMIVKILHDDLHLKAYKFHTWHALEDTDYAKRLAFATWFLSQPEGTQFFMICSDEAYFYLNLPENSQNNRYWGNTDQEYAIELPLHDKKLLVWCAISATHVYGPYFFDDTVNQHNYLHMLKTFFIPRVSKTRDYRNCYFQQDGASPHKANAVQDYLAIQFPERFIKKESWPPRSPDVNPCDFFCGVI